MHCADPGPARSYKRRICLELCASRGVVLDRLNVLSAGLISISGPNIGNSQLLHRNHKTSYSCVAVGDRGVGELDFTCTHLVWFGCA